MEGKKLFPTEKGTPQGGVISPLLANIALHGMEEMIKGLAPKIDLKRNNQPKYQKSQREKRRSISLIRYADDFVILHQSEEVIKMCKREIEKWLSDKGLELNPRKTQIVHTLKKVGEEEPGFNFLGFKIRQVPCIMLIVYKI